MPEPLEETAQVTPEPVQAPTEPTQAPDLSSIYVQNGEGPDGRMSVPDLQEAYKSSRKTMSQALQDKAEFIKRYKWAMDLEKDLADPNLKRSFEEAYQSWSQGRVEQAQNYGGGRGSFPGPSEIAELKADLASVKLKTSLDSLSGELKAEFGLELTPEQRATILEEVARTNSEDVNALYWGKFGPDIAKKATTTATKQVVKKIADNANAYQNPSNLAAGAIPAAAPEYGSPEWEATLLKDIEKRMKR